MIMDYHHAVIPQCDRIALFLDVDGTLIDFAPRPDAVVVPEGLPDVLEAASDVVGGALALVSGRTVEDLDRLFAPARLAASGLHGAEVRWNPDGCTETPVPALPPSMRRSLKRLLEQFPGTVLEDKGPSLSVHYRAVPEFAETLHQAVRDWLEDNAPYPLDLMLGELVYEIKPTGFDKGSALRAFMERAPFAGRQPIYVADHPIDRAAFIAARALGGYGLSVGHRLDDAAGWFSDTGAVRQWLRQMSDGYVAGAVNP